MTHEDCMLLMDAYRDAICLERNLGNHAGLQPAAKRIVENLGDFIALLLDTSVIGDQREEAQSHFIPIYTDKTRTWNHGPVTVDAIATWTNSDALDGKVS